MDLMDILVALVGGTVIGVVAKAVTTGQRDGVSLKVRPDVSPGISHWVPLWLTVLCGVGGVVLASFAYTVVLQPATGGVDWLRHIWQVLVAIALVALAVRLSRRAG